MKLRHLLFGVLAGVAFVACTNDNEPAGVTPVNGGDEVAAVDGYMSLKFAMPGDNATTRADGWSNENGFQAADADEIAVSGATILFFDGDVQVADPFNTAEYDGKAGSGWTAVADGSVDWTHGAVIVLRNAVKNPTSIVAILNALPQGVTVSRSTTMPQLLALAGDFRKDDAKNFVMTNSVFVVGEGNEAKVQIGAPVTADNVQKTADLAKANPVTVYVEKIVAKATLAKGTDTTTGKTTKAGKTITVAVNGWWLDNTNPQSFLVKNLATSYTELGTGTWWKDATNFRSYWATPAKGTLEHTEYKDAVADTKPIYALENTDQANPTQLVVAATLSVEGAPKNTSIVKYLSEVYTAPDFETLLYGMISEKYYTRTATQTEEGKTEYDYQSVPQTSYTFAWATNTANADATFDGKPIEDYEAVVSVTCNVAVGDLYTYNQETKQGAPVDADAFAADLASLTRKVQYWDKGATYYFTPIVHNKDVTVGTGDAAHPLYGIIRNHLYDITINSITGLGTPVANTNSGKEIIPDIPVDEETYLAAEVKILKYKVVTQEVNLGK